MKVAARIFILLGTLSKLSSGIALLFFGTLGSGLFTSMMGESNIISVLLVVVPIVIILFDLIILFVSFSKIKNAKSKKELIPIGIIVLLICSVLGGIFTLCIPEESLNN